MMDHPQFRALLRACRDRPRRTAKRDLHLFLFLGRTGLRITEALELTPSDLYLQHDPPFCAVRSLKRRGLPERDEVILDAPAARMVKRYLKRTLPHLLGRPLCDSDALFPAIQGIRGQVKRWEVPAPARGMSRRNALELFRHYARRAGLPKGITLHSLRHYRGSTLYEKTKDLKFTQEQLRHRGISSTQIYLHQSPSVIRRHLARLEGKKG
jgi:integrase/recombinase XerD